MIHSRFRYLAQSLCMPEEVCEYIESDVQALLWARKPDFSAASLGTRTTIHRWMTRGASYRSISKGGLGLLHWSSHLKALKAKWLVRYLDPSEGPWKSLLDTYIGTQ
eukprot:7659245-Prorocentrum_lima.AAC.1